MKRSALIIISLIICNFSYGKYFNLKPELFKCTRKSERMKTWEKVSPKNHIFLNIPDSALSRNRLTPINFDDRDIDKTVHAFFKYSNYDYICSLKKGTVVQSSAKIIINENSEIRETEIGTFNNDDTRTSLKDTKLFSSYGKTYLVSSQLEVSPDGVVKTFSGGYSLFRYQTTRHSKFEYYLIEGITDYKIEVSNKASKVIVQ